MSRKRKAPIRKVYPDPKFHSEIVSKFINSIMYDGKRSTAEKILYDALDKIKSKNNEDPLKVFNTAITNVKPNLECRSRRVGGATYQVPVEVKSKRAQALALRWLIDASRKRKDKNMSDGEIIHKGISQRQFARSFTIADDVKVGGAELKDGLLTIACERILPDHNKNRHIEIK